VSTPHTNDFLDFGWFRDHLTQEILPKWLHNSVTDEGFFFTQFDRQWRRYPREYNTLISQSRLLYNFSMGYELTGGEEYRKAVETGARFLIEAHRDREFGGWFRSCTRDGNVADSNKDSYGHAFAIFGLSHAFRCTGNQDYRKAAWETWEVLSTHFKDRRGGLIPTMTRDFKDFGDIRSQNPIMHLFEALLALGSLEGMNHALDEAQKTADFVLKRLLRKGDGLLPEWYSENWNELSEDQGGRIDIGHAFEWAYLLSTSVERGLPKAYLAHATNFLEYGLRIGYDAIDGGVFRLASPDGKSLSEDKRWWPQCEAIRALMHFVILRGNDTLWTPLLKTIHFVKENFVDGEYGGWYTFREPGVSLVSQNAGTDKGGEWKVDYHVVGMCVEAIQLQRELSEQ
jgi:mannobiose 2-epimerase